MDLQTIIDAATAGRDIVRLLPAGSKELAEQIVGAGSDTIRRWRQERERGNLEYIAVKVRAFTNGLPIDENASSKVAEQIIDAAKDEDREELQKLWAALIARVMTGQASGIRAEWFDLIRKFNPIDALVLEAIYLEMITEGAYKGPISVPEIQDSIDAPKDVYDIAHISLSVAYLASCGCLEIVQAHENVDNGTRQINRYKLTTMGFYLAQAVSPPTKATD